MPRDVHVVVVAFHAAESLDRCLASVADSFATTVIDNSRSQAVREVAEARSTDYVDSGGNLGFAGGVNIALRNLLDGAPCDVLLLNPDATIAPRDVAELSRALHEGAARVGAVAPRIRDGHGGDQRVEWPYPSPARAWMEAAGLGGVGSRQFFAVGAVLLLRWEALHQVGLFDERFFLYAEEADWQRRAAALGWMTVSCPQAVARHDGAGTSSDSTRREALFHAGQETYIRKWYGAAGWASYRAAAVAGAAVRALLLRGERRDAAAARARIYLRGPRRCAGLATGR